uniref:KRAB domain-containing protein n=1 Tax=Gopherus agassizii TaxID=38772 RepID=A0A452I4Y8_9SAUR
MARGPHLAHGTVFSELPAREASLGPSPAPSSLTTLPPSLRPSNVAFEDVALYFTREEWELLSQPEQQLYRDQMLRNYWTLVSPPPPMNIIILTVHLNNSLIPATTQPQSKLRRVIDVAVSEYKLNLPGRRWDEISSKDDLFHYSPAWDLLRFHL